MKKIFFLLILSGTTLSTFAQFRMSDNYFAQKWVLDVNLPIGVAVQSASASSISITGYKNLVNTSIGNISMSPGFTYGIDVEAGCFFGNQEHLGIGTGVMYLSQAGSATLNKYHIEYEASDNKGHTYRQLITANGNIREQLTATSVNIPLLAKYKQQITGRLAITIDAGILFNAQHSSNWSTNSSFDYEAIYAYVPGTGGAHTYYDNSPNPSLNDWMITKNQYEKHTSGTMVHDFDSLQALGYNVGLNIKPTNRGGSVTYKSGSIGFMVRPAITIKLLPMLHATVGGFYTYQSFDNTATSDQKPSDKPVGSYTSILSAVKTITIQSAGINVGLRYFFGNPADEHPRDRFGFSPL